MNKHEDYWIKRKIGKSRKKEKRKLATLKKVNGKLMT